MRYGLTELEHGSPAPDPVLSLVQAKAHLRVDLDDEDDLITALVQAATRHAEQFTRRVLVERRYRMTLEAFPRAAWAGSGAQDGEVWPPRFGNLSVAARFPQAIVLPVAPLLAVESIQYASTWLDDNSPPEPLRRNLVGWIPDSDAWPPRILPRFGQCWPETAAVPDAVRIVFSAGYGDASKVPADIVHAVRLILGHLHEHREEASAFTISEIPLGARHLLSPYRVFGL